MGDVKRVESLWNQSLYLAGVQLLERKTETIFL